MATLSELDDYPFTKKDLASIESHRNDMMRYFKTWRSDLEREGRVLEINGSEDFNFISYGDDKVLKLYITLGRFYPLGELTWEMENKSLPKEMARELRRQLRQDLADTDKTNNLAKWQDERWNRGHGAVAFQLCENVDAYISTYNSTLKYSNAFKPVEPYYFLSEKEKQKQIALSPKAFELLQLSSVQIATSIDRQIPRQFEVHTMKQVLSRHRLQRLVDFQDQLRQQLGQTPTNALRQFMPPDLRDTDSRDDMIGHLVRPQMTFLGLRYCSGRSFRSAYISIPAIRHSSPDPCFALSYDGDTRCEGLDQTRGYATCLVVCATVMGRQAKVLSSDDPESNADSPLARRVSVQRP